MATDSKSLAVIDGKTYIALQTMDPHSFKVSLYENMGNGGLSVFDLDRIKIPSGGGLAWTVPTLEGDKPQATVEGIVVMWREVRAYWSNPMTGGGSPPDCVSDDGETGVGNPGGDCETCPWAEFGSKHDASGEVIPGQACKQMRQLFLLDAESMLPFVVSLPPTSIKPMRKFFLQLSSKSIPYYSIVTRLALETAQSQGGIKYSVVKPSLVTRLEPEQVAAVHAYADAIKPALLKVSAVDPTSFAEDVIA